MKFLLFLEKIFSDKLAYVSQKQLSKSVGRQLLFLFFIVGSLVLLFGLLFAALGVKFTQGNVFWFSDLEFEISDLEFEISDLEFEMTDLVLFN